MWFFRFILLAVFLISKAKSSKHFKRAIDSYSYPVPSLKFDDSAAKQGPRVETINAIAPPEYKPATEFLNENFKQNFPTGKTPIGSVTFNAYQADISNSGSYGGTSSYGTQSGYGYNDGGKQSVSQGYAPGGLNTGSNTGSFGSLGPGGNAGNLALNKPGNNVGYPGPHGPGTNAGSYRPNLPGGNVGISGPNRPGGSLGSMMMGASYMRSSSPFYNFQVMLD